MTPTTSRGYKAQTSEKSTKQPLAGHTPDPLTHEETVPQKGILKSSFKVEKSAKQESLGEGTGRKRDAKESAKAKAPEPKQAPKQAPKPPLSSTQSIL